MMKENLKELFISYLNSYGGDACTMELSGKTIVSFAGSDGPDITETGLKERGRTIPFTDTEKIDEYLVEGCRDNYYTYWENYEPVLPSKSWTGYYKKYKKM